MNEKRILCGLICLSFCLITYAQHRREDEAKVIADRYLQQVSGRKTSRFLQKAEFTGQRRARAKTKDPAFYIFNDLEEKSFVIVSADERMNDVLGYCDRNIFITENAPTALNELLDEYTIQYEAIKDSKNLTSANRKRVPHIVVTEPLPYRDVPPLIKTTWGQDYPYNKYCPNINNNRCITGCLATAMAQVMNYHKYPAVGSGQMSYTSKTNSITVSANFDDSKCYDWSNMLNSYNGNYNTEQADAVANLMKACGVGLGMDYGIDASSADYADIPYPLHIFFGYSSNVAFLKRDYYYQEEWMEIITNELLNGRPVIYNGNSNNDGHSFILDGVRDKYKFHVNWGWNGSCDGYYSLDALMPSNYNFGGNQSAIINISPEDVGVHQDIYYADDFVISMMQSTLLPRFTATLHNVWNYSNSATSKLENTTFDGYMGIATYTTKMEIMDILTKTSVNNKMYWGWEEKTFNITLSKIKFPANDSCYIVPVIINNQEEVTPIRTLNAETDAVLAINMDNTVSFKTLHESEGATVTYVFTEPGNIITRSKEYTTTAGTFINSVPPELCKDYCSYEVTPVTIQQGTNEVQVTVSWNLPFIVSNDYNSAIWYYAKIRSDYYLNMSNSEPYYATIEKKEEKNYKWAFVGTPHSGFTILNKAAGANMGLTSNGKHVVMRSDNIDRWELVQNEDGFNLLRFGSYYDFINQLGSNTGPIGLWFDTRASTDIGGQWLLEPATEVMVKAKNDIRLYGENNPKFEYIVEGKTIEGKPDFSCDATIFSPVGIYDIVVKKGSIVEDDVTFINGTLRIIPAPLTITAKNCVIKQGDSMPIFEVDYNGFKNNETSVVLTHQPIVTTNATSTNDVGLYTLTPSGAEAQNYTINYIDGNLSIWTLGDVNGDGVVDVGDVVPMISFILDESSDKTVMNAYDLNNDMDVDVFDITKLINIILDGGKSPSPAKRAMVESSKESEDVFVFIEGNIMHLDIKDAGRFTAFQMDVEVPNGATLEKVVLTDNQTGHSIRLSKIGGNLYRVVGLSMRNAAMQTTNDSLLNLFITGNTNGELSISNIKFYTPMGERTIFNSVQVDMATGIRAIETGKGNSIYDLAGRKINGNGGHLTNGIYIVNGKKEVVIKK